MSWCGPGGTQNGYEGPTTWFSNVSSDTSSGTVNFSPALQDLAENRIQVVSTGLLPLLSFAKDGRIKLLVRISSCHSNGVAHLGFMLGPVGPLFAPGSF